MSSSKKKKEILPVSDIPEKDEEMTKEEIVHYQMQGDLEAEYDFMFANGLRQTMDEMEECEAKEHALEYKRECEALRHQLREQKKSHELEMARLEAQYKAEINRLRGERNRLAHEPLASKPTSGESTEMTLGLTELATHVKERFSKSGAAEVSTMLYYFAVEHECLTKNTFKLIDSIIPAIIKRDSHHTQVDVTTAHQVNINPHQVINEEKEK